MTTRRLLLRLLLGMLFGTVVVVGGLSFHEFRGALQSEIAGNLQFGASTVMERIDTFLSARVENIRVWRSVEVMQDIRVDDVDKRLSHFLSDLRARQAEIYRALLCTGTDGRVIASSAPALIGRPAPQAANWQLVPGGPGGEVQFAVDAGGGDRRALLRTRIPNAFGSGDIGYLYVWLDWKAIHGLLDEAARDTSRDVLLLDADGRVIARSSGLRDTVANRAVRLDGWTLPPAGQATSYQHDGRALGLGNLLVGAATSAGYQQFAGLGWHLVMVEPTAVSFRPVWRLFWTLLGVLSLTVLAGVWISTRLADRIARPVVALTGFARGFRQGESQPPPMPATTITVVVELHRAYVEMIEALERSREQIVRAGKLAVVGEMAAIMAHEVRTPMGILRSSAQLLQREAGLGAREHELVGFILSETERLNRLVTMLLECARPSPPEFRPHDLYAIIDGVLSLLASRAESAGVDLRTDLPEPPIVLDCDREQIMQVLLNLVLNALSFVPHGGTIAVSTHRDEDSVWVSVADSGPGVPVDLRERIFDPFFSRREGGIGLGLTIVQQIVHVHGGEISVGESAWGGAAFNIRFPSPQNR